MRRLVVSSVLVFATHASAQPQEPTPSPDSELPTPPPEQTQPQQPQQPPPPNYGPPPPGYAPAPPPEPPSPPEATGVAARAGIGIGRYTETAQGLLFESDLQPFTLIGVDAAFRAGDRGVVVVQAQAGLGIEVHMDATSQGQLLQNNKFHQEIYEGALHYRWPGQKTLFFEVGYHFTMQRLHFTDITDPDGMPVLIEGATEVVMAHGIEGGLGWRTFNPTGVNRRIYFLFGLNRGSAENDQVEGEDFSAGGMSFNARATWRWPAGFLVEGQLAWRHQNGTGVEDVQVMGMDTQAFWPKNSTWFLGGIAGYVF